MVKWIKNHLNNTLFFNTYLIITMRVLGTGFGFMFWVFAARTMAADEVGLASGAISATALLAGLAQLGLGYGLVRHLAHADNPNGLLNLSIVASGLAGLGLAMLFLVGIHVWSPKLLPLRANWLTSLLFVILVLSETLSQMLYWAFLATRRMAFSLIKQTSFAILIMILLPILRPLMSGYIAIVAAHMIATVLSFGLSFHVFLPVAQPGYRFSLKYKVSVRSSFANYSFVNYITNQIDRSPDTLLPLIVVNQLGPQPGAYFFVAWTMGRAIGLWASSIADSFFAEGSNDPAMASAYAWRSVKLGLCLMGGLMLALLTAGRFILSIYGPDYVNQGITLLYWMTFASIPEVLQSILASFLRIQDRLKAVFITLSLSNSLGILASWAGMIWLGLVGAGVGWVVSQMLILGGASSWWRWRQVRQRRVAAPATVE